MVIYGLFMCTLALASNFCQNIPIPAAYPDKFVSSLVDCEKGKKQQESYFSPQAVKLLCLSKTVPAWE